MLYYILPGKLHQESSCRQELCHIVDNSKTDFSNIVLSKKKI